MQIDPHGTSATRDARRSGSQWHTLFRARVAVILSAAPLLGMRPTHCLPGKGGSLMERLNLQRLIQVLGRRPRFPVKYILGG